MPVTVVSVCNSALTKVGAARISSITQDTASAQALNAVFDQVRDDVLRAHPWNFALKRDTLAPNSDTPDHEWDYQFDKPSDLLRVWKTYPNDIRFVVEGEKILSDEDELQILYIFRQEDPATWDACFAEAFAWRLAREVAYLLTQSTTLVDYCEKKYLAQLAEARSMDGMEGILEGVFPDTWTLARL